MRKSGNTDVKKKIEDESTMSNIKIVRVPKRANGENESGNSARKFPRAKGHNFPN